MAQGEAISVLLRAESLETGKGFGDAAMRAAQAFRRPIERGGVVWHEGNDVFFEEIANEHAPHVLNGCIFALWGVWELWRQSGEPWLGDATERCVGTLRRWLPRFDAGWWTLYSLLHSAARRPHLATLKYHQFHIAQMRVLGRMFDDDVFDDAAERWTSYAAAPESRARLMRDTLLSLPERFLGRDTVSGRRTHVKVAVVTHFYPPEPGAGALRVRSLVDALAHDGHEVTVVTPFPSFPRGSFAERRRPMVRVEEKGRVRIVRLFSVLVPRLPGSRLVHWLSAALSSSVYLLASKERFDVVIISSPPISLALPGLLGAMRHRSRLVVDLRDVFPDLPVAMGAWKANSLAVRVLERMLAHLYRRADLVVAVTPTGLSHIERYGVDPARVVLARNASERAPEMAPISRTRNGFTAAYAGNLGLTTDVDVLADAAALVANDGITIEMIGDGAQRARLDERVHSEGIRNLKVRGSFPRAEAMAMVASADISVIPAAQGAHRKHPDQALRFGLGRLSGRARRRRRGAVRRRVAGRDLHARRRSLTRSRTSSAGCRRSTETRCARWAMPEKSGSRAGPTVKRSWPD